MSTASYLHPNYFRPRALARFIINIKSFLGFRACMSASYFVILAGMPAMAVVILSAL
jgi:hypothetical protein